MFMSVISGLIVSVDAFFIGLSLGLQKGCKFLHLAIINAFLFLLCVIGFVVAEQMYEFIAFDTDVVVGFMFIALGLWYILHYFMRGQPTGENNSMRTIVLVGLVMSAEAMLITMGITLIFGQSSTFVIPMAVAFAHFGYSAITFCLARTRHVRRIPVAAGHVISGSALIVYGLLALFLDIG